MNQNLLRPITLAMILLFAVAVSTPAQSGALSRPRSEKLLNDLDVLIWSQAGTGRVKVTLRINNGAAYDPVNKSGTFSLLGDILFPEDGIRQYFEEELGGDLSVKVTYDYVEVTGTGRADSFLRIMEALAPALTNTEITKETTDKLKESRLSLLENKNNQPVYTAEEDASRSLFGEFPYGRPIFGTAGSVENISFADLIYVRERFLTADNATLMITGDVRSDYAYLAARRLLGGWNKAGNDIPATFRLPEAPNTETRKLTVEGRSGAASVAAIEAFPRKDRLYHASQVLARVFDKRLGKNSAEGVTADVENEGFLLKGEIRLIASDPSPQAAVNGGKLVIPSRATLQQMLARPVTEQEFQSAKASYFADLNRRGADELWADVETYGLSSVKDEIARVRDLTLADVLEAAKTLSGRPSVESVVIARPAAPTPAADPKDPSDRR